MLIHLIWYDIYYRFLCPYVLYCDAVKSWWASSLYMKHIKVYLTKRDGRRGRDRESERVGIGRTGAPRLSDRGQHGRWRVEVAESRLSRAVFVPSLCASPAAAAPCCSGSTMLTYLTSCTRSFRSCTTALYVATSWFNLHVIWIYDIIIDETTLLIKILLRYEIA